MLMDTFMTQLTRLAREANRVIVLPEGTEPRTIKAAQICSEKRLAQCLLLGNPEIIARVAEEQQVNLGNDVIIIDPETIYRKYIKPMVELRQHKGMTQEEAEKILKGSTIYIGTMMVQQGEADGLVSGAIHTTADTVRPALQLIKLQEGMKIVSSCMFMCLPTEVVIYADCAINPNPTAEELADIAIQTAHSAAQFGFEPRVAMISYSTMNSGVGPDVDRVREATQLAKKRRPDLCIDGPLQYDAAVDVKVAQLKAPDSPVAGRANVFIFPELNTANVVYKAVQRTNHILCLGPMLQGLRKPVNDLSRGASAEDIVYTIALTAVQGS